MLNIPDQLLIFYPKQVLAGKLKLQRSAQLEIFLGKLIEFSGIFVILKLKILRFDGLRYFTMGEITRMGKSRCRLPW